jgi:ribosomal protection tetracycline resistance protein
VSQQTLNLGILAHVDAGKTTLTERLLYAAGVIDEIGSVDDGTTQTDSLELERQRGITIKSAVVSFAIGDVKVNLIDTPGHPDFIAEVERVLDVLDGAVLVLSAVEGVQSQTLVLMRALQRLHVPTLLFVNKVDRAGADVGRVLRAIADRLTPATVPMDALDDAALVEALSEHDDELLAAYVDDDAGLSRDRLLNALAEQAKVGIVHPVFSGSARTGSGVETLMAGIAELLPARAGDPGGPVSGTVFKIERGAAGEKVAYVRMYSGTVHVRDRVRFGPDLEDKVTAVSVFDSGADGRRDCVVAGEIGKLWGLGKVRIGDPVGEPHGLASVGQFAPPILESVVVAADPADEPRLRVALAQLDEQDPLIGVRSDETGRELSVSLYGEVQKEVIEATLARDYGLAVAFRETTTIHVERPLRSGEAVEILNTEENPFHATIGLRVDPAPPGSGIEFLLDVDTRTIPLYAFKRADDFSDQMQQYVRRTLEEGLHGWHVTDCVVTMTRSGYSSADGPPSTRGPLSSPADFRKLTPIVLMEALARAGTVVCEPMVLARIEIPLHAVGAVLPVLARLEAVAEAPLLDGNRATIQSELGAARVYDLKRQLVALTGGEVVLETGFAGYRPVSGDPPTRPRTTPNPLNRPEYLMHLARRVASVR